MLKELIKKYQLTLIFILSITSMKTIAENNILAHIFKMPDYIETSAITTAGHYILSSHLVRPLLKLDKFGKIQSDLAIKWEPGKDFKSWKITIGNERFSNGELITTKDVLESIKRQTKFQTGVHFPFNEIIKVEEGKNQSIIIFLKHPRNNFIYDLTKPEFGVLHKSDYSSEKNEQKFNITSGPYFLTSKINQSYHLKKNTYYNADVKNEKDLILESSNGDTSATLLENDKINFLTTQQNLTTVHHSQIKNNKKLNAVMPHVAFSFWLSLNPNSKNFKDKVQRNHFQSFIKKFKGKQIEGHSWERSNQLYLPDGDGRPTNDELLHTWSKIENLSSTIKTSHKSKLRILPLKISNSLLDELIEYIKKDYDVEFISYNTEEELIQIIKSEKFDIKISSNDFSSIDLSENLKTTFNASRPYVFLNKGSPILNYLNQAIETDDKLKRSELYKKIGIDLLENGLIAPIAYQRIWFYFNQNFDISAWSQLYPEISFWKVKFRE